MSKRYIFTAMVFVLWIIGFYIAADIGGGTINLAEILSTINPLSILAGLGLYVLAVGAGVFTLYKCFHRTGLNPPLTGLTKAWIFGSFVDNVGPTITPVGEASMAYFLERFYRISYSKSLAAIGMYVSAWGISVSIFSTIAVFLVAYTGSLPVEWLLPVALVVSFFIVFTIGWLTLLTKKDAMRTIVCKIMGVYNRIHKRIKKRKVTFEKCVFDFEFDQSYESLSRVMKNKRQILISVVFLGIPQLARVLCIYVLILGFGTNADFFPILGMYIIASIAGLLSLIPSGLGVYESVLIGAIASTANVPLDFALGAIFLERLIFLWTTNIMGGLIGITQGVKNITKGPEACNIVN